jgi:hypothetical protein
MHLFAGELANVAFRPRYGRVCVLTFYMDDSADKKRERIFVVSGFLGRADVVFEAERHWKARVEKDGLKYFRTTNCNNLDGEFERLVKIHGWIGARQIADDLLSDLWPILKSADLLGFCFLGPMSDYNTVQAEPYSEYVFERDPYIQAHQHLIHHVAAWVCENVKPPEPVAFAFDEHNKAALLMERWDKQKDRFPKIAPCMGTMMPLDDRQSPAIQMGDLLANTAKRVFEDRMSDPKVALEDLTRICGHNLTWVGMWDEKYLRELREVSIDAATTPSGIPFEYKGGK